MSFWKAKIENPWSPKPARQLRGITISQQGERFVTRFNFADGSFFDVEIDRVPRFDLGENAVVTFNEEVDVPTEGNP